MPMHDWTDDRGWDSLHPVWQVQLIDWLQQRLPSGYRAYIGSVPALVIDAPVGRPDVGVRTWEPPPDAPPAADCAIEPDTVALAAFERDDQTAVRIERGGQLVAAVEIISPANKDRPDRRERYTGRYFGYIRRGVHLMLIDALPRPRGFSFADAVAANLGLEQPPTPAPFAVSYRVGGWEEDQTLMTVWRRPMAVGRPLPTLPLALTVRESVPIDLEHTYREAARRVYLD
jgi:hypothetical protein